VEVSGQLHPAAFLPPHPGGSQILLNKASHVKYIHGHILVSAQQCSDDLLKTRHIVTIFTFLHRVVTGLRFVKVNRVIHLQIQEAGLLPRGEINMTSVQWRPVDDYRISDSDVYNGKDYHTLSWEQRAIDLDDLVAPDGSVLTGKQ
jgi:hypothetical protein